MNRNKNFFDHLDGGWTSVLGNIYKQNQHSLMVEVTFKSFFVYEVHKVDENREHYFQLIVPEHMKHELERKEYKNRLSKDIFSDSLYSEDYATIGFIFDNAVLSFTSFELENMKQLKIIDDSKSSLYFDDEDMYQDLIDEGKIVLADPETMKFPPLQQLF